MKYPMPHVVTFKQKHKKTFIQKITPLISAVLRSGLESHLKEINSFLA